ncbi:MAG: hypothetical protein KDH88_17770 [Chromatiales bacterium]|nr:hypothetical protein [Chromatiales bacterium]
MFNMLVCIVAAAILAVGAVFLYGVDGLVYQPWVEYTFWWLFAAAVAFAFLQETSPMVRGLCALLPKDAGFCRDCHCEER